MRRVSAPTRSTPAPPRGARPPAHHRAPRRNSIASARRPPHGRCETRGSAIEAAHQRILQVDVFIDSVLRPRTTQPRFLRLSRPSPLPARPTCATREQYAASRYGVSFGSASASDPGSRNGSRWQVPFWVVAAVSTAGARNRCFLTGVREIRRIGPPYCTAAGHPHPRPRPRPRRALQFQD